MPDHQESMSRFANILVKNYSQCGLSNKLLLPPVFIGLFLKNSKNVISKWGGYLDKYFVMPIYLILDKRTGEQYVGSTYGADGLWQRWSNYAKNGNGGNKLLKKITEVDKKYANNFQWSILTTLSKTITKDEAIAIENKYKEKLGSRAFGLNEN